MPLTDYIYYELGDFRDVESAINADSIFAGISESEFLKFRDELGITNLERLFNSSVVRGDLRDEREQIRKDFDKAYSLIDDNTAQISWNYTYTWGLQVIIPKDRVNRNISARDGGYGQSVRGSGSRLGAPTADVNAFIAESLKELLESKDYVKDSDFTITSNGSQVKKQAPDVSIIIWCRALSRDPSGGSGEELKGRFIDVSAYVESVNTYVGATGGNFSISLAPLQGYFNTEKEVWELKKGTADYYKDGYVAKSSLYKTARQGKLERANFYFNLAISKNDLVFISFEKLKLESRRPYGRDNISEYMDDYYLSSSGTDRLEDMIGLVDTNSIITNPSSNDVSIEVRGRDLSKLIIDDGSYMYPLLFSEQSFKDSQTALMKRNALTNAYDYFATPRYQSIQETIKFIINVLSNIRVIPNEPVSEYRPLRSRKPIVESKTKKFSDDSGLGRNSILTDINKIREANSSFDANGEIDYQTSNRVFENIRSVVELSLDGPGSSVIQYSDYKNLVFDDLGLSKASLNEVSVVNANAQVTIFGPADRQFIPISSVAKVASRIIDYVKKVRSEVGSESIELSEGGIWQLVELVFDKEISNRRLVDTSLGRPDSSLIDLITNFAQYPFIEFYMDTYGRDFNFIFRKPILDQERIVDYVVKKKLTENLFVSDGDVVQEQLDWDDEVYSMYELELKDPNAGNVSNIWGFVPTAPFPEIAEIYGNRRLKIPSSLIPYNNVEDKEYFPNLYQIREQAYKDLKFMIDIHSYLPFTRKGTITINGDRRFKKGTWFEYIPTGEIFYITSVTNDYSISDNSIDRTTVLTVERGMVKEYVTGERTIKVNGKNEPLTYFNIIKSQLVVDFFKEKFKDSSLSSEQGATVGSSDSEGVFKVNRPVFDFFVKRKQFYK